MWGAVWAKIQVAEDNLTYNSFRMVTCLVDAEAPTTSMIRQSLLLHKACVLDAAC